MRIVRLQAEGFKRLVAVDITPDGDLVEVRGNNAEGKSSVLDAIFAALGGKAAAPIKPVRTGEEYAIIRLDLGDLKVTRYFDAEGTDRLKVENAEGAVFSSPQTMLDKLVGAIAFDPLAFARMDPKDQAAELRRLVPLAVDLDALAAADKADYAARRDTNREGVALKARVEAIEVSGIVPPEPDRDGILARLSGAGEANAAIERDREARNRMLIDANGRRNEAAANRQKARELRMEADRLEEHAGVIEKAEAGIRAELDALPPLAAPVDTAQLSADLAQADRDLALLGRIAERKRLTAEMDGLRAKSEGFTQAMADRQAQRAKALADAKMPVEGLSIAPLGDDMIVTYQNEPFSQASGAQQLRVSAALAMAANPKLRVMIVKDGSLLDPTGIAILRDIAKGGDFQIWGEFVGDGDGTGIIMEAGKVRGAADPERVEPPRRRKAKGEGVVEAVAAEPIEAGDPVKADDDGRVRPLRPRRTPAAGGPGGLFGE